MLALIAGATLPVQSGAISPDRLRFIWSPGGCHCLLGEDRATTRALWSTPTKILEIRGAVDHLVFSPDGRRIAFANRRGDLTANNAKGDTSIRGFDPPKAYSWSFIATYDFKTGRIAYVDPTFADDSAPEWSWNAGASEMMDVVGAANFLKSDPSLKVRHVGIHGLSWGGYITAQALAMYPNVFDAGFDVAGVHEFFGDREKYSPVAAVKNWRAPIFLAQRDDDRNVDFYQGVSLAKALGARSDIETKLRVVPDETHDLSPSFEHLESVYGERAEFLIDHLQAAP